MLFAIAGFTSVVSMEMLAAMEGDDTPPSLGSILKSEPRSHGASSSRHNLNAKDGFVPCPEGCGTMIHPDLDSFHYCEPKQQAPPPKTGPVAVTGLVHHFHPNHPYRPAVAENASILPNPVVTRQPNVASEEAQVQRPPLPQQFMRPKQDVVPQSTMDPREQRPNAVNLPAHAPNWGCQICTFHNEGNPSSVCSMCNHPNPVKVAIPSLPPSDLSQVQTSPSRSSPTHQDPTGSFRRCDPPIMVQTGSPTHVTMEFRVEPEDKTGIRTEWNFKFNLKEVGGEWGEHNLFLEISEAIKRGEDNWSSRKDLTDYASLESEFKNGIGQVVGKDKGWTFKINEDYKAYDQYVPLESISGAVFYKLHA